jgi:hypothetical protein
VRTTRIGFGAALIVAACGNSGLAVSGQASAIIHQTGQSDVTPDPWFPADGTAVDAPPGTANDVFGTCTHAGSTWTADLHRAGVTNGIAGFHLVVSDLAATASLDATVDGATFSGSCSVAPNQWADDHSLRLAASCKGLTLGGDTRSVDVSIEMTVENCTGP